MTTPTANVQLIVFDWAGTIVDFGSRAPAKAFVRCFEEQGVTVTDAEARGPMGLNKREHLIAMLRQPEIAQRWLAARGTVWTEEDVARMYEAFVPHQLAAIKEQCQPVPELLSVAEQLQAMDIKIGGTTGYFRAAADAVADVAKASGFLPEANVCADDVSQGRPAPWMIYEVMRRLDVWSVSTVVNVGDTTADIRAARNAGCWSIGVCNSSSLIGLSYDEFCDTAAELREEKARDAARVFEEAGSHYAIRSLEELPRVLQQINQRLATGETP